MSGRLQSGQPRLDGVLGGGLPENAINLVIGLPGSGKTILAEQYVFANATPEHPALYLSTVSEPFDKLIRYGQTLSFFDPNAIGQSVFYEDLGATLNEKGLSGALEKIANLIKERRPAIMVIDSFKALAAYADSGDMRPFLHELAGRLSASPLSSFWIGEYAEEEIGNAPEFAIADAIISLVTTRNGQREARWLRIMKLRGSEFAPGQHAYRLSADGLDVFPRLADLPNVSDYAFTEHRVSSGIAALDQMLADGYRPGTSTLCAGPSGTGKTLMGLHFIFNGADDGEPGEEVDITFIPGNVTPEQVTVPPGEFTRSTMAFTSSSWRASRISIAVLSPPGSSERRQLTRAWAAALALLTRLSGRRHHVLSAVCVIDAMRLLVFS